MPTITDIEFELYIRNTKTEPFEREAFKERVLSVLKNEFKEMEIELRVVGGGTEFHPTDEELEILRQKRIEHYKKRIADSYVSLCPEIYQAVLDGKFSLRTALTIGAIISENQQMAFLSSTKGSNWRTVIEVLNLRKYMQRKEMWRSEKRRKVKQLITMYGRKCFHCQKRLINPPKNGIQGPDCLTLDHILPVVKGGTNEFSNLILSCYDCNQKRNSTSFSDFRREQSEVGNY